MFENPSALALLALLLPVIILYILKPRPKPMKIPSLMLLLSTSRKRSLRKLIETLVRDPLLLIQLLAIILLVLSIADPYFWSVRTERTIIVLDASASMSATDVLPSRFSAAVDIAQEYIRNSDRISLVLAENRPVLLFQDADERKALAALRSLKQKETGTDLNGAVLFAAELTGKEKGRLAVISDFSGQDIILARKIIEEKGIPAEFRQVGSGGSNAGIIEATVDGSDLKFIVKNYNNDSKEVQIKVIHNDSIRTIDKTIGPGSREFFHFPDIGEGRTKVLLLPVDDLPADNSLFISMPAKPRVLLIGDSRDDKNPIQIAFNSIPSAEVHSISFAAAPRRPDYDLVVLHDYTRDSPLPGTMDDLRGYVEGGGVLFVVADSELPFIDTKGLLPVNVTGMAKPSRFVVKNAELTDGIDFGVSGYLKASLKEGAVELASAEDSPVLAYWNIGKGKVMYLGINDRWGDFHKDASYPIFWFRVLKSAALPELNFRTGTVLTGGENPQGSDATGSLFLDETGFYTTGDKTIAASLLDEKESDISVKKLDPGEMETGTGGTVGKIHLDPLLSVLAVVFIALELYYLRYRGEI